MPKSFTEIKILEAREISDRMVRFGLTGKLWAEIYRYLIVRCGAYTDAREVASIIRNAILSVTDYQYNPYDTPKTWSCRRKLASCFTKNEQAINEIVEQLESG
jgi:hypothetical protein